MNRRPRIVFGICEDCGCKIIRRQPEECLACGADMCQECFRDHMTCEDCRRRARRMKRTIIRIIQGEYALKQLKTKRAALSQAADEEESDAD